MNIVQVMNRRKLRAYRNTGLTPSEVREAVDLLKMVYDSDIFTKYDNLKKECDIYKKQCDKCREYENYVLERAKILEGVSDFDRLHELNLADKDERAAIFPCKLGSIVFRAAFIHKCDRCPNNRYLACKYDGQHVECLKNIRAVKEEACTSEHFYITPDRKIQLKHGVYLTYDEAVKSLSPECVTS